MALFGNLQKSLFGDSGASDTIRRALEQIQNIQVPTAESMQIQLEKLVQAGVLTPEQAQTMLAEGNAFDNISANNAGMGAELSALGSLQNIIDQGGRDATEQADLNDILNTVAATTRGANEATLQQQAQRGALTSGMSLAAQLANNTQGAQQANTNALRANADAQNRQMQALQSLGTLGGNVQGQQYGADANRANAANAIAQFNAQQANAMNQFNTGAKNTAQAMNLQNAQNISNTNVGNENANRERNSNLIQQNFQNQLGKAGAAANVAGNLAQQQQNAANQNQSLWGGIIGTGATAFMPQAGAANAVNTAAPKPQNQDQWWNAAHGGMAPLDMTHGGDVPGEAKVPGDSPVNDTVHAKLSPGEVVLPRSVVQNPDSVHGFLQRVTKDRDPMMKNSVHPKDISAVLHALTHIREGGI